MKYLVNAGVPEGSILSPILFSLCISGLSDDGICNIAIYAKDTTFYCKCEMESDLGHRFN